MILGIQEWCSFPDLNIPAILARVDSGATTSSLHAVNFKTFEKDGENWLSFDVQPLADNRLFLRHCEARLLTQRMVKSSNGAFEYRYVIETTLHLGKKRWPIQLTLSNRENMEYRMLLGREAMQGKMLVDPDDEFCLGNVTNSELEALYSTQRKSRPGLKIGVLASNPKLYSNKRLMEAGKERGHDMIFINTQQAYMNINATKPSIHYKNGENITELDAIIPRLKPSVTFYGCALTRQYQSAGVFCLNNAEAIACSRDKLNALQLMASKGVKMPVTGFANSPQNTRDLINLVGGAPLIIKLLEGTQGKGVILAETEKSAISLVNSFKSVKANFLVQQFVEESAGSDLRCFVIGGKVIASIERYSTNGDFRANLHLGGKARIVKITPEERKMATLAAKIMGLEVAGVDILRTKTGPQVLEVNSSPGLEGIESETGLDIAGGMLKCIEKRLGFNKPALVS